MRRLLIFFVGWALLQISPQSLFSQQDYPNHKQLTERLNRLQRDYPRLASLESLTTTAGGKDIWLISVGRGDLTQRPAIAIVGGVEGNHLLGTELAVQFAEKILENATESYDISQLLDSVTFYIFPDMSPDAREQYFSALRYERFGNANPYDHDRDGKAGEDPYNDLNADKMITLMRVRDPSGNWIRHPDDERIMINARPGKGERGEYLVYSEGIDDDKDGRFNEDGEEGVFFNRNFTYDYQAFSRGSGEHAVSENETRAIADFLFAAKNVFAVVSFGPANNLSEPLQYNEQAATGRVPAGWQENDITINQLVSAGYQPVLEGKGAPGSNGDFFQWAYFHYGRFSFSTPAWHVPTANDSNDDSSRQRRQPADSQNEEVEFLKWAEQNNVTGVFVPWTKIDHPDFPGKEVEVGGIAPFVMKNPPYHMVAPIADRHYDFIAELASMRPITDITGIKTETLGNNLFRITVNVGNKGSFPTVSQIGQRNRWVQKVVVRTRLDKDQQLISGKTIDIIDAINGHSSTERSWLVRGKGMLVIRAGSESTGFREVEVRL